MINKFDVMEMRRGYSGWFVKYHVDLNPIMALFLAMSPFVKYHVVLLYALAPEHERHPAADEEVMLLHVAGKVSYSHRTRTVTTTYELTMKDNLL